MANYPAGLTFAALLYLSSILGTLFLLTPVLPLVIVQPRLSRWVMDRLMAFWKMYAVALYEIVFGVKVVFTGRPGEATDASLVLMNHRTRLDWLFYFSYELRYGSLTRGKIILKSLLRNIPGPGWAMQGCMFMFLHRRWEVDKPVISRVLQYFQYLNYKPQILLFPEGTDLTEKTKAKSGEYAENEGLPKYSYVLHPRTTGFIYLVQKMINGNGLGSVMDLTIAYPMNIPQNELDLLAGNFPREVHIHMKSKCVSALDTTEQGLHHWCQGVWREKEERLQHYYSRQTPAFPPKDSPIDQTSTRITVYLYIALVFWSSFVMLVLVGLLVSSLVRWYALFSCLAYFLIGKRYGGLDMAQASVFPDHSS